MLLLTSCKYHNGIRNINVICFFIAAGAQMKHRLNEQFRMRDFYEANKYVETIQYPTSPSSLAETAWPLGAAQRRCWRNKDELRALLVLLRQDFMV